MLGRVPRSCLGCPCSNSSNMASKEQEIRCLESLHRARPDLPLAGAVPAERPDFIVILDSCHIGIEVTRYTPISKPGEPRAEEQESLQQRTMRLARDAYQAAEGPPLHVGASFNFYQPLTKARAPELANKIARFLLGCSKRMVLYQPSSFDRSMGRTFLPELDSLSAMRVPTEEHAAWYAGQGGWVRHAEEGDIVRIVSAKEERIVAYRERCDALWLLIVFDVQGGANYVRPPVEPVSFGIRTGFDRLFCLAPVGDYCVEIPVSSFAA